MKNTFIFLFLLMAITAMSQKISVSYTLSFSKLGPNTYRAEFLQHEVDSCDKDEFVYDYTLERIGMITKRSWNTPVNSRVFEVDSVAVKFSARLTRYYQNPNNSNVFYAKSWVQSPVYIINPRENYYVREDTGEKFYFPLVKRERKKVGAGQ
jgi:hypothetical protein